MTSHRSLAIATVTLVVVSAAVAVAVVRSPGRTTTALGRILGTHPTTTSRPPAPSPLVADGIAAASACRLLVFDINNRSWSRPVTLPALETVASQSIAVAAARSLALTPAQLAEHWQVNATVGAVLESVSSRQADVAWASKASLPIGGHDVLTEQEGTCTVRRLSRGWRVTGLTLAGMSGP
ncbi:MAG: hypothetical protein M0T79_09740 [Actinomycetota bacterium]|nr:hypothetical protein [Actinomycetota bacterium]